MFGFRVRDLLLSRKHSVGVTFEVATNEFLYFFPHFILFPKILPKVLRLCVEGRVKM